MGVFGSWFILLKRDVILTGIFDLRLQDVSLFSEREVLNLLLVWVLSIPDFQRTVLCSRGDRGRLWGVEVAQGFPLEVSGEVEKTPISGGSSGVRFQILPPTMSKILA